MGNLDVIVIGGGPGGCAAAIRAAELGAKVILVEKERVGGTCLNKGCIPTKILAHTAEKAINIEKAFKEGLFNSKPGIDFKKLMERKNETIDKLFESQKKALNNKKITTINADAKILGLGHVLLTYPNGEEQELQAEKIILATGSKNKKLPVKGAELPNVMDSDSILQLKEQPENLLIIGGGVIGLEFASIFSALGTKVVIVEMLSQLAPVMDKDISRRFMQVLKSLGVQACVNTRVGAIEKDGEKMNVILEKDDYEKIKITTDMVLVAIGREPLKPEINSEKLEMEIDDSVIKVNEKMETSVLGIYAVGDCTGGYMLAHTATAQGIVAAENALGAKKNVELDIVPNCIFSYPEMACAGLGEDEAKKQGKEVLISKIPYSSLGKAIVMNETSGMIKLIVDKKTGTLLGSQLMGYSATELIAELTLAIKNSLHVEDVADTIHAHPTIAEGIMEAASAIIKRQ